MTQQRQQQQQQSSPPPPPPPSKEPRPPLWKVWFVAARPHTLTASISPNIIAYHAGVALLEGSADWDDSSGSNDSNASGVSGPSYGRLTLQWTAFCMLMQLGTNLHNDYADFVKGADNEKRVGQARATQKGWLTPFQTAMASGLTLLLGLFLGMGVFVANLVAAGQPPQRVATMVLVVLSSVFNAFAYTGGPWPLGYIGLPNFSLGYSGLGDLFVFLYFGLVATLTPPLVYAACSGSDDNNNNNNNNNWQWQPFVVYAVQVAVLSTNIIVVNNLRDRHTDVLANKRTLAVRFGATFCRIEYASNLLVAYGLVLWQCYTAAAAAAAVTDETNNNNNNNNHNSGSGSGSSLWWWLLPLASAPLARREWLAVCQKEGSALNPHVGGAAKVQLLFCVLSAIAVRRGSSR